MTNVETVCGPAKGGNTATLQARTSVEVRIEAAPIRAFMILSILYILVAFTLSSFKLLWLDELITLHIAQLGSASAIWHALASGVDPNPPVTHLLVHYSRMLFGPHEWAYRLPDVAGYWIGMLSLFVYLRNCVPATWALGGTVLSMTMAAFDYSYESRSYGVFYGLAMLAFLCWSRSVSPGSSFWVRQAWMGGMVLALAAGVSTNYFAVLAFIPIAAGEVVRSLARSGNSSRLGAEETKASLLASIDIRIWVGLAAAGTPLLAYRSLISHAIAQFAPYAWNKVSMQQVYDSYTQMVEVVLYPILALLVLCILFQLVAARFTLLCRLSDDRVLPRWITLIHPRPISTLKVPAREITGILFLMAYPFLGYLIASIRGGMLSPRFVIPVCFGFAIAATLLAYQLFQSVPRAGTIFLCFVTAWFVCREACVGYWYEEQKQCFFKVLDRLSAADLEAPAGVPIVIPDPLLALTFQHYAAPSIAERVVFPVDFPAIRYYRHDDSPEENLWAGRNLIYTLPILPLAHFENLAGDYLVIAGDGNWLLEDLKHHRYPVERLPIETRADAIGGFTPLARGTPEFYLARGEQAVDYVLPSEALPIPFHADENLPQSKTFHPDGEPEQ